jgi:hypothetical protein
VQKCGRMELRGRRLLDDVDVLSLSLFSQPEPRLFALLVGPPADRAHHHRRLQQRHTHGKLTTALHCSCLDGCIVAELLSRKTRHASSAAWVIIHKHKTCVCMYVKSGVYLHRKVASHQMNGFANRDTSCFFRSKIMKCWQRSCACVILHVVISNHLYDYD